LSIWEWIGKECIGDSTANIVLKRNNARLLLHSNTFRLLLLFIHPHSNPIYANSNKNGCKHKHEDAYTCSDDYAYNRRWRIWRATTIRKGTTCLICRIEVAIAINAVIEVLIIVGALGWRSRAVASIIATIVRAVLTKTVCVIAHDQNDNNIFMKNTGFHCAPHEKILIWKKDKTHYKNNDISESTVMNLI
jgi:hypothetical protein